MQRTVIISDDAKVLAGPRSRHGLSIVASPLELMKDLDACDGDAVVVFDGIYAGCVELAVVLLDLYPDVRVIDADTTRTDRTARGRYSPAPGHAPASR